MLVLVKATNDDRQIPALTILLWCVAVHYPLITRRRDGHSTSCLQVVHVERSLLVNIDIIQRDKAYRQTLIVEGFAGIDFQGLLCHLSRMHLDGSAITAKWHTIHHQLGTMGIRRLIHVQVKVDISCLRLFTLVAQIEFEASRFAERHTTDALLIHLDNGILNLLRTFV